MSKIKTFEKDLKPGITPEFIKKLCELAEGFEFEEYYKFAEYEYAIYYGKNESIDFPDLFNCSLFPLLLHRAVEGINKQSSKYSIDIISNIGIRVICDDSLYMSFLFCNYIPCHITACEMAIIDCLLEVLK